MTELNRTMRLVDVVEVLRFFDDREVQYGFDPDVAIVIRIAASEGEVREALERSKDEDFSKTGRTDA